MKFNNICAGLFLGGMVLSLFSCDAKKSSKTTLTYIANLVGTKKSDNFTPQGRLVLDYGQTIVLE